MSADLHKAMLMDFVKLDLARGKGASPLTETDDLVASEIMDSLGIMKLIIFLEEKYAVKISDDDLTLENFENVESIWSLVQSKMLGRGGV